MYKSQHRTFARKGRKPSVDVEKVKELKVE